MESLNNKGNSKSKKLIKNTLILSIGKFCTQFVTFLLLPLYTTYLSTSDYGIVDLVTTYIVLLVPIVTIQIEMYLFRYLIDYRSDDIGKRRIISNAYLIVACLTIVCILIFSIISKIIHIQYFYYLLLMVLATIASNILLQTSRGLGDNIGYSIACIIIGVINIICNLILILCFNLGIVAVFIATISSNLLGSVFLFFRNKIYLYISKQSIDKSTQVDIVKYSLPLVPNGLVWWVINASDRTLITIMINTSANGIYSVSNKFSNIINSLYTIFNMSWMESVSMYINDKDDFLKKAFNTIFNLICSLCLGIISVMFIAFPLLIQEAYIDAYKYIPILIIASVFNMLSSNLSAIYIAKRRTKEIASTTILASIINIVINFVFIKMIGLYAAALSTLFAFFALFIIRYLDVQKYVDIKISNKNILIFTILFALSYLTYVYNHLYLNIIMLVINIVACSLINKNEIIKIINKILKRRC